MDTANLVSAVKADVFTWMYPPYTVGNGQGNVNWRLNPCSNISWYIWLHSLRWVGVAVDSGHQGTSVTSGAPGSGPTTLTT